MAKTYLPTLRITLRATMLYMARWQTLIEEGLTPEQITAFRDCLGCLTALIGLLGAEPVVE
jgi:hypothetical protein